MKKGGVFTALQTRLFSCKNSPLFYPFYRCGHRAWEIKEIYPRPLAKTSAPNNFLIPTDAWNAPRSRWEPALGITRSPSGLGGFGESWEGSDADHVWGPRRVFLVFWHRDAQGISGDRTAPSGGYCCSCRRGDFGQKIFFLNIYYVYV